MVQEQRTAEDYKNVALALNRDGKQLQGEDIINFVTSENFTAARTAMHGIDYDCSAYSNLSSLIKRAIEALDEEDRGFTAHLMDGRQVHGNPGKFKARQNHVTLTDQNISITFKEILMLEPGGDAEIFHDSLEDDIEGLTPQKINSVFTREYA